MKSMPAAALVCTLSLCALSHAQSTKPDALLQIDMNRAAVVERIVAGWKNEIPAAQLTSFRTKLAGLRADHLLAANISGSFEGVLEIVNRHETSQQQLTTRPISSGEDQSKAVGDPLQDLVYTPVTPCRLFDSRAGQNSALGQLGGVMTAQSRRTLNAGGQCGIPATGVASVFISFHAYNNAPATLGIISFMKPGDALTAMAATWTGSNWATGTFIAGTNASGAFDVFVGNPAPAMTADMVVDVTGYFMPPNRTGDGLRVNVLRDINGQFVSVTNGATTNRAGPAATVSGGGRDSTNCLDVGSPVGSRTYTASCGNSAEFYATVVSGGISNSANAPGATIGGGVSNLAKGYYSSVSGGSENIAEGQYAVVSGGTGNRSANGGTVSGGLDNSAGDYATVSGGSGNSGNGFSSVMGGNKNIAIGELSSILGGANNITMGRFSLAAGRGAQTGAYINSIPQQHANGTFVWADSNGNSGESQVFRSVANDQFAVRSRGGVAFRVAPTESADTGAGCALPAGGAASWSCSSDRNLKESIKSISPQTMLNKVLALPVTSWQFIGTNRRHIGPMAQDFRAAFGLGADDKNITTSDVSGVALAAIQGLNQKLEAEKAKNKAKESEIAGLKADLALIKKKLGL